jgi:hypothetical protein
MVLEAFIKKLTREKPAGGGDKSLSGENLEKILEQVINWIETHKGKSYFVAPLEEFFSKNGKAFPDDPFYQDRMNYFLEYCVLERPLTGVASKETPLNAYLEGSHAENHLPEMALIGEFRHSIFEVVSSGDKKILLKDLQTNKKHPVRTKGKETFKFLQKGTIFQGYIFGTNPNAYLGQGMILHPKAILKTLKKYIKNLKKASTYGELELLQQLALTNMRYLRMQHVNPTLLYSKHLS